MSGFGPSPTPGAAGQPALQPRALDSPPPPPQSQPTADPAAQPETERSKGMQAPRQGASAGNQRAAKASAAPPGTRPGRNGEGNRQRGRGRSASRRPAEAARGRTRPGRNGEGNRQRRRRRSAGLSPAERARACASPGARAGPGTKAPKRWGGAAGLRAVAAGREGGAASQESSGGEGRVGGGRAGRRMPAGERCMAREDSERLGSGSGRVCEWGGAVWRGAARGLASQFMRVPVCARFCLRARAVRSSSCGR